MHRGKVKGAAYGTRVVLFNRFLFKNNNFPTVLGFRWLLFPQIEKIQRTLVCAEVTRGNFR